MKIMDYVRVLLAVVAICMGVAFLLPFMIVALYFSYSWAEFVLATVGIPT